jgi:hypothetical protein
MKTTVPLSKRKVVLVPKTKPKKNLWKPQLQIGLPFYKGGGEKKDFCALSNSRDLRKPLSWSALFS